MRRGTPTWRGVRLIHLSLLPRHAFLLLPPTSCISLAASEVMLFCLPLPLTHCKWFVVCWCMCLVVCDIDDIYVSCGVPLTVVVLSCGVSELRGRERAGRCAYGRRA